MGPISEQDMEFSLDCYFRQKWTDSRLAFSPIGSRQDLPLASKMLKDIWVPDTYIRNGRRSYLHTLTVPNVLFRVRSDGQVHVSQRLTIKTRCKMFFKKFPMDSQACPIEIGSLGYFNKDIIYNWKDVDLDSKMGNMLSQYQLLDVFKSAYNLTDPRDSNKSSSVLKVYFKLQRQQGFYILQIYTPCNLIVVMSWVSFWINKEASPARVALGIMTVLSMSTLGFGLRTDLPKVSHSTALDIYIISCFGFVFAALVEYAVINYAHIVYIRKKVHDLRGLESNRAMERMGMFAATIMGARRETINQESLVLASSEKTHWYHRLPCAKQEQKASVFYRMAVKAAKARRKLRMNDPARVVNKIDSASKVIFPLVFILFNVGYWLSFLYWIPDEINSLL
uniref:Neur_chan_LBD domain-containing protein n=1 Tax=Steinernema glaseri TaxID=37863 RepID=A0A1I7ZIK9_9BILA